jgi:hypothetical protein
MLLSRKGKTFEDVIGVLKGKTQASRFVELSRWLTSLAPTELRDTIASDAEVDNANDGQADVQPDKVMILDALVAFCQQL